MGFLDKIKSLLSKNAKKIDKAVDKGGDMVDKKTDGKHHDKIEKAEDAASQALGKLGDDPAKT